MRVARAGLFIALLAMSGCASTEAYRLENGDRRISTSAITSFGGAGAAKSSAVKKAAADCDREGRVLVVVDEHANAQLTDATVDLTYRCAPRP